MQIIQPKIKTYAVPPLELGEGPFWHVTEQALYFADILAPRLYRLEPASGALQFWNMPADLGSFGLCHDGRAIVALRTGIYFFDFKTEAFTFIVNPEAGITSNRFNDGKVGPDGRFWVGSMDDRPEKEPIAGLYRIDHDGTSTTMLTGLLVSNGLAWSPDGRIMYHSDSRHRFLQAFDYDLATGGITHQRQLRTFTDEQGRPDGAAMDSEGCYWSAGPSAGVVNRIAADGTILRRYELPLAAPTMPCFGGPGMRTLFVTSLKSSRLGNEQMGTLISFDVDVAGTTAGIFGK